MNTKRIFLSAIIAALPFGAMAGNIQGNMYTAPIAPTQQTPAPTASVSAPYGRINIDTDDQEHIATTAYVKGAYNSAIAAVNKVDSDKQDQLVNFDTHSSMGTNVVGANDEAIGVFYQRIGYTPYDETMEIILPDIERTLNIDYSDSLITAEAAIKLAAILSENKQQKLGVEVSNDNWQEIDDIVQTIHTANPSATALVNEVAVANAINGQAAALNSKRVRIYTTWDDDTAAATTLVPFETAQ